jgi:hypothetical protein
VYLDYSISYYVKILQAACCKRFRNSEYVNRGQVLRASINFLRGQRVLINFGEKSSLIKV